MVTIALVLIIAYTNIPEAYDFMNSIGGFADEVILSSVYLSLMGVPLIGFALPYLAWIVPSLVAHPIMKFVWQHKPSAPASNTDPAATKVLVEAEKKLETVTTAVSDAEDKKKSLDQAIIDAEKKLKEKTEALATPTEAVTTEAS